MKENKIIATASEMSNLIGMYAFRVEEGFVKRRYFIAGKANNEYFIVQAISAMTGEPNVAKLWTIKELLELYIIPTREIADEVMADCIKNGWRYFL